jgi:CMP-N-acetylneuraminic acid synthetase
MSLPVLFLIPARAGSQRVPGKNLRTVAGIPLVAHAIRIGRQASALVPDGPHAVVVSTDDPAIAAVATAWHGEVPWLRPAALATASATSIDVALHALDALASAGRRFRAVALLQPTSPLTAPADVSRAIAGVDADTTRSVVSVVRSHPATWHVADTGPNGALAPSSGPGELLLAGAFYVITPELLRAKRRFVVPGATIGVEVAAERALDIDEEADLVVAEALARARPVKPIQVGGRAIGDGEPAFLIAEAGVNHDGDLEVAHRLVDAAAAAGADAVKFQTFDPEALAAAHAPLAGYQAREVDAADQRAMLARLALAPDAWPALQRHATDRGIVFLSSPFDEASADLLDRLDVPALKVASGELTNHPSSPISPHSAGRSSFRRGWRISARLPMPSTPSPALATRRSRCSTACRAIRPTHRMRTCGRSQPSAPRSAGRRAGRTTASGSSCRRRLSRSGRRSSRSTSRSTANAPGRTIARHSSPPSSGR